MEKEPDENEIFESIIKRNKMEEWLEKTHVNAITIADIYQGLSVMSSVQADLHEYLKTVITAIFVNNQSGSPVEEIPQLTSKQIVYLKQIFEFAALFLEQQGV